MQPSSIIAGVLLVGVIAAGATFRDYGVSWDEPLFYEYGAAQPYAYSLPGWLGGQFDLRRSFGPIEANQKIYGPAYLSIGLPIVNAMEALTGVRHFQAWHLVNFITFLAGGGLLYILARRWLAPWPSLMASLLYLV